MDLGCAPSANAPAGLFLGWSADHSFFRSSELVARRVVNSPWPRSHVRMALISARLRAVGKGLLVSIRSLRHLSKNTGHNRLNPPHSTTLIRSEGESEN